MSSWADEYAKLRNQRDVEEVEIFYGKNTKTVKPTTKKKKTFAEEYTELRSQRAEEDTAPVRSTQKKDEEEKRTWFRSGLFEDGYQFGDITKTILGTVADVGENIGSGIIGMGEKALDAAAYIAPFAANAQFYQNGMYNLELQKKHEQAVEQSKTELQKFIQKDLYDEEKIAKKIVGGVTDGYDYESSSVFGEKTDSLIQSGGQLLGTMGLQAVGVPWFLATGATSFGSEVENAMNQDATWEEAGLSATISAGAEILSEKLSGGISFGGKTLDDAATKWLGRSISNKLGRTMAKLGMDMVGEGSEEVFSQVASNLGTALYKEESLEELLLSEEAFDEYVESFIGGAALGGVSSGIKAATSKTDYVTELTENEQKVVDKVYKDRLAEKGKVTEKEKAKIYDKVLRDLEKGYISTDTIEEVLGGESYKGYKQTVDYEDSILKEYEELGNKTNATLAEQARYNELGGKVKDMQEYNWRNQAKTKLSQEVSSLVQSDRLMESYNEKGRRGQTFTADLSRYDEKQQSVIQKAIDSGILNNTNRTHEFVDMVAKISADKGVLFDFTNNQKLKDSGFAVDGKFVNGYVTKDGITVNIDSAKSMNSIVGHKITHVLEGTEFYDTLQKTVMEYAKAKGDYQGRYDSLSKLYENIKDANVDNELTADLVGDYLFTDSDFIQKLSTEHRNVFQKIYDEIKYLCKVATAGSKEARELERVKKAFEDAYRADGKNTETKAEEFYDSTTKYSLRVADKETLDFLDNQETVTTYKTMQLVDGKLYPPMASRIEGKFEDYSELGAWEQATEHPELIKDGNKFKLDKGKGQGSIEAAYNPYMHSSNLVLNDQFSGAYKRDNLVTVECKVPVSELSSGYHAEFAKDSVGWHPWHTGTVAGQLRKAKGTERQVLLSRWIKPVRIVPDSEVAAMYKELLDGTDVEVPDNVVTPALLNELKKAGVKIKESGRVKYSISDSDGKKLTKEQQEYFKDSKMRDDEGNLKVMYHGSQDAGFHVFDSNMSDDGTSFFFVDRNEVASTYSGTSETYEAKTIRTAEDMNKFLAEIGYDSYEAVEKNGKFELLENGDHVAWSDTAQGIYEEFCWYEGVGEGDANYKVYLNLKNPLEVDAKGRPWNKIDAEFSQETYDRFKSLTPEEKEALSDLAGWEDFRIFNSEIQEARDNELASAYQKMGEDVNIYDLFSAAADNFSEEAMRENSRKYLKTRDYAQKAQSEGYDGVIFKNIVDNGGYSNGSEGASTVAIAFESNQIKSVANEKPTGDKDIRYSVSDAQSEYTTESEVSFSLSNDTAYMDKAIARNESSMTVDTKVMAETKALRERIAARMNAIKDRGLVGLPDDIEGNTYIANSSYDGTEENTTICPRSLASEAFVDAVSEYLGRPLTIEEQIYISQDLQGRSMTPECTYCYVATDRKAYRAFLGEYISQRDTVLEKVKVNPNSDVSRSGELYKEFLNGRKDTNPMYSRFKMWVDAYKNGKPMIDGNHLANINKLMGDINSEFGAELKPQIVDAMKYAQSASWAKKRVNYVAYNGHILNWKQDRINKLNSHYGLRMYSFSDFHPAFVLENMQMITDASVRGLKMLGYTKDTDFVDIFAPTGMNINVSTFGFEAGGNVYENNIIGANWDKAKALREQYPNVGVTFVATNDTLVEWALKQEWIDVVIPYHLVRTGAEVAKAFGYTNYTSESADTKDAGWTKGKDKKYIAPTEHNNDKATYLEALLKNHLKPRFARFLNNPNYMKLVNECRQSASESKPVQPVFNEDAAMVALAKLEANGYYQPIGGSVDRMYEIAAEVAEDMTQQLAPAMSLSEEGDTPKQYGSYHVSGKDIALAPVSEVVAENATTNVSNATDNTSNATDNTSNATPNATPVLPNATVSEMESVPESELFPDDLAPIESELDRLNQESVALEEQMFAISENGNWDSYEGVARRYTEVQERIAELENEISESESGRTDSLTDEDAPPEQELYPGESTEEVVENPFEDRDWYDMKNRSVKAYMYENPEVKPFFQEEALNLLGEMNDGNQAERWYNDELHYASGGEQGFGGIKRNMPKDIEEMLDSWHMSYDDIRKGLNAIIEDHGAENIAAAKKIEFMLNRRLLNGYESFYTRKRVEPNQDYINLLYEKQVNEYSEEAFSRFMETADKYAPEDIAPVVTSKTETTTAAERVAPVTTTARYEAIKPKPEKYQRMARATPAEQARAEILVEEPEVENRKLGAWARFKNAVLDKGMVFEDLSLKTGNRELQARWNSIRYATGKAQRLVGKGNASVSSLNSIRKAVEETGKVKEFYEYLYHKHNIDRMTLAERFHDTPNKPVFGDSVTADISREAAAKLERTNPEFKQFAKEVYGYMTYLREEMVANGIISHETAQLWQKMYPNYVPIRRAGDTGMNIDVPLDTRRTGVNAPIKKATGGSRDILPLFDTMGQRTLQTYRAIAKNRFGVELKNTLKTTIAEDVADIDETIDNIDKNDGLLKKGENGMKPTFTVFENGKRVTFEITDEMYNAMKPTSDALSYTNKIANTVSNIRRGTLTEYNPWFLLKNAVKDVQDIIINSQHPGRTYLSIPKAIKHMTTNGHYYQEYLDNGGEQNTYFDNETNTFQEEKKIPGLYQISRANNVVEMLPRLAEYIASRESGKSVDVAMLDAARVTTNFAAGGDLTKFANRNGFTFLNASVQGAVQQARNIREAKRNGLKGALGLAARYVAAGLPVVMLNHLIWDDDEEYAELSDYVKQNYYIVGKFGDGKFVRIPKGRTVAVIQNAFEQMENLITGNDEADFRTFLELAVSNLAPNNPLDNNILAPILQVANNKTWYGDDLVPTRLQDLPAGEQYDETTDSISKWLGETFNVSPYKANYLLDQYSGVIGDTFLPMLTPEAESGDSDMLAPLRDMFTTDSVLKNQNVSDFYDLKDELMVNANGMNATDEDKLMSKYINSVSSELSELYQQKREIQNSDMSDEDKYSEVRDIQKQIVETMKEGMANYQGISYEDDYRAGGEYARVGNRVYKLTDEGEWQKLSDDQVTKYEVTKAAGNASYASDGTNHYRWYEKDEEWVKITDKQYEKQGEVTSALRISPETYWENKEEYDYAYEYPENYAVAKAVGGYDAYKQYSSELYDIKADKDEWGQSISGSRKAKVKEYIDNLDADYYTKLILYKSEYTSYDDENYEIIEYLNGRDDISYDEMEAILLKLGFKVDSKGNITW